jgi:6-phosphogluconolactonase
MTRDVVASKAEIHVVPNPEALYRAAAAEFMKSATAAVKVKGSFTVALSGGSTPRGLYSLLAMDPALRDQVPWESTYFFWGDERHVPPDHSESNFRTANETLLSRVPAPASHVWRIKGEYQDAARAADEYAQVLRDFFKLKGGEFPRLDLVLLGMGPDGHTASLFPGTKALLETDRLVVANWVGKFYSTRLTLTAPVLNSAARVLFLIQGEDKAPALKAVLEGPYEPAQLPAQLIRPHSGRLEWLVEQGAGRMLGEKSETRSQKPE